MTHTMTILNKLCQEREEAVRREFASVDRGEFDEALDRLEREAENKRMDAAPLVKIVGKPVEKLRGIRL